MRCILALCLLCTLVVPAAAAERALVRYCRARPDDDDCREIVRAVRRPQRVQVTLRGPLLEVVDVAHPRFEDHASVARLRRDKHHWVVVAVTGVYAAAL